MFKYLSKINLFIVFSSIFYFFISCSTDPVIIDPETLGDYYVFCTLSPGLYNQQVLVGKSIPESQSIEVTDAKVAIYSDNQYVLLTHIANGMYKDLNNEINLRSGTTYNLLIELQNGNQITGKTKLPGDFEIFYPPEGDTVQHFLSYKLDTLLLPHIQWSRSETAKFYSVYLIIENADSPIWSRSVNTFYNKIYIPELVPKFPRSDTLKGEIILNADLCIISWDSTKIFSASPRRFMPSYSDFTSKQSEEYYTNIKNRIRNYDESKMNLNGAIGVFNSVFIKKHRIYLKVKMDWEYQNNPNIIFN